MQMRFSITFALVLSILSSRAVQSQNLSQVALDTALARALYERGGDFQKVAKYDTAIILFDKSALLFSGAKATGSWVRCLNAKAQCLQLKGNYDRALDALRIGSEAEQRVLTEAPVVAAQRLVLIGTCYRRLGKFDSAFVAARNAAELSRSTTSSDRHLQWDINTLFAGTYFDLGEHDSALVFDERALKLLEVSRKEDQEDLSGTYGNIGEIYESRGDYQKALDYFERSLDVRRTIQGEKNPEVAIAYNNIAAIYMRQGDYDLSVEYYLKSLSIMNEILESDNPSFGFRYNNIAMAYRSRGEFEKALEAGNKSKAIFVKKLGAKHPNVGGVVNNIGRTYSDMKQYDRALEAYQEALAIWEPKLGGKHPYVTQSYFNIGEAYGNLGEFEKAVSWLQRSLTIRRETLGEKNVKVSESYNALAKVYASRQQLDTAIEYRQKALIAILENFNDVNVYANPDTLKSASDLDLLAVLAGKAEDLRLLYEHTRRVENLKMSLETYEHAARLVESIRRGFGTEGSKLQLGALAFDVYEQAVNVALKLSEVSKDAAYLSSAFEFAERSKAGVLLDAISESDARQFSGIPDSLLERESTFRSDLAYYQTQIQKEKGKMSKANKAKVVRWEDAVFDTYQQYAALTNDFEKKYPNYHTLKFQTKTVSLAEIQKRILDNKTALLEYVVGDSSVTIFVVTKKKTTAKSIQLHALSVELVRQLRRSLQNLEVGSYLESSYSLYRSLIEPVKRDLNGIRKLTIIPDGILNYLPFEALLTRSVPKSSTVDFSRLPYLIRDFEISYHLSARLLEEHVRKENVVNNAGFVGFAPVFAGQSPQKNNAYATAVERVTRSTTGERKQFAELRESENEVNGIVKLFESKRRPAKAFLYTTANEAALKSPEIQTYRFVHVATHGMINEDKPNLSALIFAAPETVPSGQGVGVSEDGVLYAGEIYNLKLNADLVVLSACESGLGTVSKGEGILGFTRGFLYAGAQNLLVSLWQVADKSTAELMLEFYRNILKGQSYASALRAAKITMIKGKTFAHPLEWSPFVLTGR